MNNYILLMTYTCNSLNDSTLILDLFLFKYRFSQIILVPVYFVISVSITFVYLTIRD